MQAVIYCRATDDAPTNDVQEDLCRKFCKGRGWTVASVHFDVCSDDGLESRHRDGFAQLMAEIEKDHDGIVVVAYDAKRIGRQDHLWQVINAMQGQVDFCAYSEPFDTTSEQGRMIADMLGVWSRLDPRPSKASQPLLAPYPRPDDTPRIGRPPMSATVPGVVSRIHQLKEQGLSLRAIAEQLNQEGIPSARGGKWWVKTVRSALGQSVQGAQ